MLTDMISRIRTILTDTTKMYIGIWNCVYIYQYTMQPAKKNVLTTTQKNTHPVWGPPGVYPARNLRFLQVAVPMFWVFLAAALLGHRCGIEWNQLSKVPETNAKFITLGAHWICVFFCFCFWFLKLVYLNWQRALVVSFQSSWHLFKPLQILTFLMWKKNDTSE